MHLLPHPKVVKLKPGRCHVRENVEILQPIDRAETGAYRLSITPTGCLLQAADRVGLFYAAQTLTQIDRQYPKVRPCMEILDWPDYPVRGLYHDVTRGKVPTLETLLKLAETCAHYKLNHLQLYIEHTFAYRNHCEVWSGADPLVADEIRALDARCAELHIDLVPSFSTFGHFYTWISRKFPELNELDHDISSTPFCWWDRMMHYTLNCSDLRSIELVREIIHEVRPLFRSRYFNICADETFDLGNGKNQVLADTVGKGRLYVDFLKKIMAVVKDADAIPMFWGDIIGHHPELLSEVPKESIALDWDYSAELDRSHARLIAKSGREFYVCPSVAGYSGWLPEYDRAYLNITRFAKLGLQCGASGLLNTDWGDYGHINMLGPTIPGIVLGAAAAWNPKSSKLSEKSFTASASRLVFGDATGQLLGLLRELVSEKRAAWQMVCWIQQPRSRDFPDHWFHAASGLPNDIFKYPAQSHAAALHKMKVLEKRIEKVMVRCNPPDSLVMEEIRVGLLGLQLMEELYLTYQHKAGKTEMPPPDRKKTAQRLMELDRRLSALWKKRNKRSEYFRIRAVLLGAASDVQV